MPVIDIFVAFYIMRNSNDPSKVMLYQLAIYTGIPISFLLTGSNGDGFSDFKGLTSKLY